MWAYIYSHVSMFIFKKKAESLLKHSMALLEMEMEMNDIYIDLHRWMICEICVYAFVKWDPSILYT